MRESSSSSSLPSVCANFSSKTLGFWEPFRADFLDFILGVSFFGQLVALTSGFAMAGVQCGLDLLLCVAVSTEWTRPKQPRGVRNGLSRWC